MLDWAVLTAQKTAVLAALSFGFTVRNHGKGWVIDTVTADSGEVLPVASEVIKALCDDESVTYRENKDFLEVTL